MTDLHRRGVKCGKIWEVCPTPLWRSQIPSTVLFGDLDPWSIKLLWMNQSEFEQGKLKTWSSKVKHWSSNLPTFLTISTDRPELSRRWRLSRIPVSISQPFVPWTCERPRFYALLELLVFVHVYENSHNDQARAQFQRQGHAREGFEVTGNGLRRRRYVEVDDNPEPDPVQQKK